MAFEKGNTLAAKAKVFDAALRRAISQDDGQRLRDCAEKLLDLAASGEPWAVKELADRLDGKAVQVADISINDQRPEEMSDADLLSLAAAGSSRAAKTKSGKKKPSELH